VALSVSASLLWNLEDFYLSCHPLRVWTAAFSSKVEDVAGAASILAVTAEDAFNSFAVFLLPRRIRAM